MSNRTLWVCCLLIAAAWLAAGVSPSHAQTVAGQELAGAELRIQELKVQVLPEFDDPRTLVVVQGRLAAASADFPQRVVFRLPAAAQINQMAFMDMATGGVVGQAYESQIDPQAPEWALVGYTLENPHFFYEYYLGTLPDQKEKSFVITWNSLQPIDHLLLEVAEPIGATGFALELADTASRVDPSLGLTYHQIDLGAVPADEQVSVAVSYVRESHTPSFVREGDQAGMTVMDDPMSGQASTAPVARSAADNLWLWLAMPLGAAAVLAGVLVVQRRLRPAAGPRMATGQAGIYCRVCGARLRADAQFCHLCGAETAPAVAAQAEVEGSLRC